MVGNHHFHPLKNGCLGVPGTDNLQPSLHVHMIFSLKSFFHLYLWKLGELSVETNKSKVPFLGGWPLWPVSGPSNVKRFFSFKGDFWVKKGMSSPYFQPKKMQDNAVKTKCCPCSWHVLAKRKRPDVWLTVQNCPGFFPGSFSSDVRTNL